MIERYFPPSTPDRWGQIVREEIRQCADPALICAGLFINMELLLSEAGQKIQVPVGTPRPLTRFPLVVFKPLWRVLARLYEYLFHNQRTVNALLLKALHESLTITRSLAAKPRPGLPEYAEGASQVGRRECA